MASIPQAGGHREPREPRERRARRMRSVVALCRARLAATRAGRVGRVLARLVATGFGLVAVALRLADGPGASLAGLVPAAAPWIAWIAGASLAYAAAEDRAALDRGEGLEALAAARGISPAGLSSARALAAMTAIASAIGGPLLLLSLLTAALAGRPAAVIHRAGLGLGALVFAAVAGVTLGGVAALSAQVGRARGRWLLLALIVGPWALADLAGHGAWSIPGALGAVLEFVVGGGSRPA
jgi:hypothetical protein